MKNKLYQVREIPISAIDPPKSPIRTRADEKRIQSLADDIRAHGLIHPILVRPRGKRFEVVTGHRRLIACDMAGLPVIPAIVCRADDSRTASLRLAENFEREDVNIVDEALYYQKILKELNLPISELAKKIRRSEDYIRVRLEILDWDPPFLEALATGQIGFTAARFLSRITDKTDRIHYLNCAINAGANARVCEGWLMAWREKRPTEPPPPETIEKEVEGEKVIYCTEPCWVCGDLVPVGEAMFPTCHRKCYLDLQRLALQIPPPTEGKPPQPSP